MMIYELRNYECYPGKLPELHDRFSQHTVKYLERHGIENVGFWVTDVGPSNHELTWLAAFDDPNQRTAAWKEFLADPDWQQAFRDSHKNGVLVKNVRNQLLVPTAYSPLQ